MTPLVVFDLDGTLVDSRRDLADSTNEMLGLYGAAPLPLDAVTRMVGEGAKVLVARALAAAGVEAPLVDALGRFRAIYDRRLLHFTRPYDGIPEVVAHVRTRAVLAVLTNKPEAPSRRLIDAFGWADAFRWVVGGDSAFPRKPDPAGLRHLISEAGVAAGDTLLVGDSRIDVETGRRAGVDVCGAAYGFNAGMAAEALAGARWMAASPAGLITVLDHRARRN